jgi:hypothetical protein
MARGKITEFHRIARGKGWRLIDIGNRWSVGVRQMTRVAQSPTQKDMDAVIGLPEHGEDKAKNEGA